MPTLLTRLRRRGFTAVELLVVVVVLSALAALGWGITARSASRAATTVLREDVGRYRLVQTAHQSDGGAVAATPGELPGFSLSPRVRTLAAARLSASGGYVVALEHPRTNDVCTLVAPMGLEGEIRCGVPEGRPADVTEGERIVSLVRPSAGSGTMRLTASPTARAPWGATAGAAVGAAPSDSTTFVVVADGTGRSATVPIAQALSGVTLAWAPVEEMEPASEPVVMMTASAPAEGATSAPAEAEVFLLSSTGRLMALGTLEGEVEPQVATAVLTLSKSWDKANATITADGTASVVPAGIASWRLEMGTGSAVTGKALPITAKAVYRRTGTYPVRLSITDKAGQTVVAERTLTISAAAAPISAELSTVAAAPAEPAAGEWSTVTVTVRDVNGLPVAGRSVVLAATGVEGAQIEQPVAATNAQGVATGRVRAMTSGVRQIGATAQGVALDARATVTVLLGAPSAATSTMEAPAGFIAGEQATARITVRDAVGQLIPGATIEWVGTGVTATPAVSLTDDAGVATTVLSGTTAGAQALHVTAPGGAVLATATVTVAPAAATALEMVAGPTALASSGPVSPTVTLRLRDEWGNSVPSAGVAVTATVSAGTATLTGAVATTGVDGRASFGSLAVTGPAGTVALRFDAPGLAGVLLGGLEMANAAPVVGTISCVPASVATHGMVTCTLPASDPEGQALSWEWSAEGLVSATGNSAVYSRTTPGTLSVGATVRDAQGMATAASTVTATFTNQGPVITTANVTAEGATPEVRTFDLTDQERGWAKVGTVSGSTVTVPTGTEISVALAATDIDGGTLAWASSIYDEAGYLAGRSGASYTYTPTRPGRVRIHAHVTDGQGSTRATIIAPITITNRAPSAPAVSCTPTTTATHETVTCTASGSTDSDGGTITYSWSADGRTGAATGASTTYSRGTPGPLSVTVTATDGQGGSTASAASTLNFTNRDPSAPNVTCSTTTGQTLTDLTCTASGSVDGDGGAITYEWSATGRTGAATGTSTTYRLNAPGTVTPQARAVDGQGGASAMSDGPVLTFTNRPPTAPTVSCAASAQTLTDVTCTASGSTDSDGGTISYTWSATGRTGAATGTTTTYRLNAPGTVSVTAQAADGQGGTSPASTARTITFTNRPPTTPTVSCAASAQTLTDITCSASGSTDSDGGTISYSWSADGRSGPATGTSTTYRRNTPGAVSVTAQATDGQGGVSPASAPRTITFDNRPPTAASISCTPAGPLSQTTVTCTASGSTDPDGGTIGYTWSATARTGAATGASTTYRMDTPGSAAVSVTTTDGQGGSVTSAATTITWGNRAPTVGTTTCSPALVRRGEAFTCTPSGWSDPDGGTLTYNYGLHTSNGAYGISSQTGNGAATFSHSASGTYATWVQAHDNQGSGWVGWIPSNVVTINEPPSRTSYSCTASVNRGETVSCTDNWSDPEGDAVLHNFGVYNSGWAEVFNSGTISPASWTWSTGTPGTYYVYAQGHDAHRGWMGWGQIATTQVMNRAPNTPTFSCATTSPQTGVGLNCSVTGGSDPDGDALTYSWSATYRHGAATGVSTWYMRDRGDPGPLAITVTASDPYGASKASTTLNVSFWDNQVPRGGTTTCTAGAAGTRRITCTTSGWWDPDGHAITHYGWVMYDQGWNFVGDQTTTAASSTWTGLVAGRQYHVTMNGRDAYYQHTEQYWVSSNWATAR